MDWLLKLLKQNLVIMLLYLKLFARDHMNLIFGITKMFFNYLPGIVSAAIWLLTADHPVSNRQISQVWGSEEGIIC